MDDMYWIEKINNMIKQERNESYRRKDKIFITKIIIDVIILIVVWILYYLL